MNTFVEILNSAGKSFVGFSADMLIQASVLITVLFAVDLFMRRRIRGVIRYWIWTLVLVKLVLPPSLISPIGLGQLIPKADTVTATSAELPVVNRTEDTFTQPAVSIAPIRDQAPGDVLRVPSPVASTLVHAQPSTVHQTPLSWQGLTLLIWMAVVPALLLLLLQRVLFVKGLVAQAEPCDESLQGVLDACRKRLGLSTPVALKLTPVSGSPAVCGLRNPVILMPRDLLTDLKRHDLEAVLLHELAHVIRGDLWLSLFQTLLQMVYFYNPLLWLANWQIRKTRETAVDEAVLVALKDQATAYPEALVGIARLALSRPMLSLRLIGVVENKSDLNRRVRYMLNRPFPKTARLGAVGVAVLLGVALLLPMAAGKPPVMDLTNREIVGALTDLAVDPNSHHTLKVKYWWQGVDFDAGQVVDIKSTRLAGVDIDFSVELKNGRRVDDHVAVSLGYGRIEPTSVRRILTLKSNRLLEALVEVHERRDELLNNKAVMNGFHTRKMPRWFVVKTDGKVIGPEMAAADSAPQLAIVQVRAFGDTDVTLRYWLGHLKQDQENPLTVLPKAKPLSGEKLFSLNGRVTDNVGRPMAGVEVRANCGMGSLRPTGHTLTDEQGQYVLEFGPGMHMLNETTNTRGAGFQVATIHASKPGYYERALCRHGNLAMADSETDVRQDWKKDFVGLVLPNQPRTLNFVMEPAASIHGLLIDLEGRPLKDQRLWITGDRLYPSTSALASVTTDEQGRFTVNDVPLTKFQLMCEDAKGRDVEIPFRLSREGPWYMKILHNGKVNQTFTLKIIGLSREPDILEGPQNLTWTEVSPDPLPDADQARFRNMLVRMQKANQYWLVRPPRTIQSYTYAFTLGDRAPVQVNIDDPSRAASAERQGISYYSAIHRLSAMADKVVFTDARQEGDNIVLDFVLPMRMKMAAGNGIAGTWRGYFSSSVSSGTLWLDQARWVPVRLETKAAVELFTEYAAIGDGAYAPLGIAIRRSEDMVFDWRFKLHTPGLWLLDEARYGPAANETRDIVALVHDVQVKGQPGGRFRRAVEPVPQLDWQRTGTYMPPNPEVFFPNDAEGGKALDALFDAADKDKRSDEEILSTVRKGFRRTSKHKTLVLSWIGNKYIWNKDPQHAEAIEIMYHAVPIERHYAVYFGLSVMKNKSPNVLQTLADICMQGEDVGRITWGIGSQKEALVAIIRSYENDSDPEKQRTAKVLLKHFAGEQDFEQWKRDEDLKRKRAEFGDQMPELRAQLLTGNSRTRRSVLDQINRKGLTGLMDDSFLEALIACAKDPDHRVRSSLPRMVGNGYIWGSDPQRADAIALAMSLSRDEVRDIRYNAVYFGLSTVRNKSEAVIERLITMALADHENNLYGRITWGLRGADPKVMESVLQTKTPKAASSLHDKASYYFLYKQLLEKDPPPVLDWQTVKQAYPDRLWVIEYSPASPSGDVNVLWRTLEKALPQDLWVRQMRSMRQRNGGMLLVRTEADSKTVISTIESLDTLKVGQASAIPGALMLYLEELDPPAQSVSPAQPARDNAIQKLIDEARPGQTVTIPNGTHTQQIRINKPLTLRGESRDGCIFEVRAQDPAIHVDNVTGGQVRLEHMTVAWQMGSVARRTDSSPYAVWISNSQAVVEDCWIRPVTPGTSLATVALQVDGTEPVTVQHCRFDGFEYTMCFGKAAQGRVTDCLVLDGGHQGITGYANSDLTVERCIVSGYEYHGIRCTGGTLTVKDCLIADVRRCGIYLGNKHSQGSISNCLFQRNHSGVAGYYTARFDIKNNVFMASSQSAIGAWNTCQLTVEHNVFVDNAKAVVVYQQEGTDRNVIKANTFWQNETNMENCAAAGESIKENPLFTQPDQGQYSLRSGPVKAANHGLRRPAILKPLWDTYQAAIQ